MSEPRYPFLHVPCPTELADEMSAWLFGLGAQGVEERDASTMAKSEVAKGLVLLVAAFETQEKAQAAKSELGDEWPSEIVDVVGDGWRDGYKEYFKTFRLGERLWVWPPWESAPQLAAKEVALELEPGRAFGTGKHETTSLIAEYLEQHAAELDGQRVLDVGTGSGILGLAALRFGCADVIGNDIDADAVETAQENARRNGLEAKADFRALPLSKLEGTYSWVLANIETRILVPMSRGLCAKVAPGGRLVLSGILEAHREQIESAFSEIALDIVNQKGDWLCMVFRRPAAS